MRRRRQKTISPAVSLFPFLAVLICTLGVLIVLLVLAVHTASTQKATSQQQEAAEKLHQQAAHAASIAEQRRQLAEQRAVRRAEQIATLEKLEDEVDRHELEAEGFDADRPRLRREVAHARDYRAHLEKELKLLEEEATQLVDQIKLLDTDLLAIDTVVEDAELQSLRASVASAQQRLVEKRANTVLLTEKKFAIVPYHGKGGTGRIPVFLECDSSGVTLQPWNIRVTKDDFYRPVSAGNPIDAALVAVKSYFNQHQLADDKQRPYPLLVIRPDGAQSYGLVRRALVSWDDEFGYELVTADKDLDFGEVDPQLQEEVKTAVEKSKQIQLALKRRRAGTYAGTGGSAGTQFNGSGAYSPLGDQQSGSDVAGSYVARNSSQDNDGQFNGQGTGRGAENAEPISGGDFQQASFQGSDSDSENATAKIQTSFQPRDASNINDGGNANAVAQGDSQKSSQGPNQFGSSVPSQSLAGERGNNWALPTETDGATGYVRPVSIVCSARSLAIKNVAGRTVTIDIGPGEEAIDQMVNIVWQRIDSWGIAGANAFWKPNLVVTVEGGGEFQFAMLKQRLKNSGLGIEEASP